MTRWPLSLLLLLPLLPANAAAQDGQDALRYRWNAGDKLSYQVTVVAGDDDKMTGTIRYTVDSADDKQAVLTYHGGLKRSVKRAAAGRGRGPARGPARGPRGPGRGRPGTGRPPSPFGSSTPRGLTTSGGEVTVGSQGDILNIKGDSQLPFLLGHLSILVFEPLPEAGQANWSVENAIGVSESGGATRRPLGPRGPRGRLLPPGSAKQTTTGGSEKLAYQVAGADETKTTITKTYSLDTPGGDGKRFQMAGTGSWTFDKQRQAPGSLDIKYDLSVQIDETTVKIPLHVTYQLLSEKELAQSALQQARGGEPIPAELRATILKQLQSKNVAEVIRGMNALHRRKPTLDAEVAGQLRKLKEHPHPGVVRSAGILADKWILPPAGEGAAPPAQPKPDVVRTWSDSTGTFQLKAAFVALQGDNVRLRRESGDVISVPLTRLSDADQAVAKQLAGR